MQHLAIQHIKQVDAHRFQIIWNDGREAVYRLNDLQRKCPCAGCVDEATGERRVLENEVQADVRAKTLQSVGRYGLKIQFTSGCSSGVYDYTMLYEMSNFLES
ncbi:MAG: DUF971 domain-containing protein [Parachlamydiaceae bacterium]